MFAMEMIKETLFHPSNIWKEDKILHQKLLVDWISATRQKILQPQKGTFSAKGPKI